MIKSHSTPLSGAAERGFLLGREQLQFLATKVVPPRCPGLIDRPRLLAMASRPAAKRLAVIKAPAGFGKSPQGTTTGRRRPRGASHTAWKAVFLNALCAARSRLG